PQDGIQAIARAGEWIDHAEARTGRRGRRNVCDMLADAVAEGIADGFERGACQDANTARIPLRRCHAVQGNRVRIAETVPPELLDFPQFDHLIPLGGAQQKVPIVSGEVITRHGLLRVGIDDSADAGLHGSRGCELSSWRRLWLGDEQETQTAPGRRRDASTVYASAFVARPRLASTVPLAPLLPASVPHDADGGRIRLA